MKSSLFKLSSLSVSVLMLVYGFNTASYADISDSGSNVSTESLGRVATLGSLLGEDAADNGLYILGASPKVVDVVSAPANVQPGMTPQGEPVSSSVTVLVTGSVDMVDGSSSSGSVSLDGSGSGYVYEVDVPDSSVAPSSDLFTGTVTGSSVVGSSGSGLCPVSGEVSFSDTWAAARSGGRSHQGTDMFASLGTPVVAVGDGIVSKVSRVDDGSLGGVTVSYVTADGDRWYNAHLREVASGVEVGSFVSAGQQIGSVGQTGNARTTPPHLHIELHPSGAQAVPNYEVLRSLCG